MRKFAALRAKTWSYLTDDRDEFKKSEDTKKCLIKRKLEFEGSKYCLEATQTAYEINQLEKK